MQTVTLSPGNQLYTLMCKLIYNEDIDASLSEFLSLMKFFYDKHDYSCINGPNIALLQHVYYDVLPLHPIPPLYSSIIASIITRQIINLTLSPPTTEQSEDCEKLHNHMFSARMENNTKNIEIGGTENE